MANVPQARNAWQPPQARIDGERLLKEQRDEKRFRDALEAAKKLLIEENAKLRAAQEDEAVANSGGIVATLQAKIDALEKQIAALSNLLTNPAGGGGGGKRMVAKVLERDFPGIFSLAGGYASQVEAEAGTSAVKSMSPLRTKQAIDKFAVTKAAQSLTVSQQQQVRDNIGLGPSVIGFHVEGYTAAAAQDAINRCIAAGGGQVIFPCAQEHIWETGVVVDLTANIGLTGPARVSLIGPGSGSCIIKLNTNSATALTVKGPVDWPASGGGYNLRIRLQGFWLNGQGPDPVFARDGIVLQDAIGVIFDDVAVIGFHRGIQMTDTVITRFYSCLISFNNYGILTTFTPGALNADSPANEMLFSGTHITSNRQYGAWFKYSNNITFVGGSFEANGLASGFYTSDVERWDLRLTNCGFNGGMILQTTGTHFESSAGDSNIWIEHGNYPGHYNIDSDFVRNELDGVVMYATNCIRFDTTNTTKAVVNIRSTFHGVPVRYTPNAARPYIGGTLVGTKHRIYHEGSVFESDVERPAQTYTPVVSLATPGTSSFAYTTQYGEWEWIGPNTLRVTVILDFTPTIGTGTGLLRVSLPVAGGTFARAKALVDHNASIIYAAGRTTLAATLDPNATAAHFSFVGSGVATAYMQQSHITDGASNQISFTLIYETANI